MRSVIISINIKYDSDDVESGDCQEPSAEAVLLLFQQDYPSEFISGGRKSGGHRL
jgi:hypothetical protein